SLVSSLHRTEVSSAPAMQWSALSEGLPLLSGPRCSVFYSLRAANRSAQRSGYRCREKSWIWQNVQSTFQTDLQHSHSGIVSSDISSDIFRRIFSLTFFNIAPDGIVDDIHQACSRNQTDQLIVIFYYRNISDIPFQDCAD